MSKANVYNWIKKPEKLWISKVTARDIFELDELYWFVERKVRSETRENIYLITLNYIPVFARRSRCFCRKLETLEAVLAVFIDAYNKFGEVKLKHRIPTNHKKQGNVKRLHKYRDLPFSVLNFF